jgi:hypothetical protein
MKPFTLYKSITSCDNMLRVSKKFIISFMVFIVDI